MKLLIKSKALFITILIILIAGTIAFVNSQSELIITIPNESQESKQILRELISLSKGNIDRALIKLESTSGLDEYTEYKKQYILAKLYEKKQDISKSISILESLLNKNYPLKERVLFHYARLNTIQGNDKVALNYFNKLIRDFPQSKSIPQAKYFLAQTLLRLRLNNDAIKTLLSLKNEFPKTQFGIATNYYLGEYAYNNNNFDEVLGYWRNYLTLSPDGRFATDIANFIKTNKNLKTEPHDYTLIGNYFFHKKDYKNAAYFFKIEKNPKHYYKLGYSLFRENSKKEAATYLEQFAKAYPRSKNAKFALLYSSKSIPPYSRQSFWEKTGKEIPELTYYTIYKIAQNETNKRKKRNLLKAYIEKYPDTEFALDAVWEIMWSKISEKDYSGAENIAKVHFEKSKDTPHSTSETRAKIGFWLGKIAEVKKQDEKALEYYRETSGIIFDNYYCHRAKNRLLALTSQKDPKWNQQKNISDYSNFDWQIPRIVKEDSLSRHFGITVAELINLEQYDEAIDLIGKNKSPSKQITAWLKALNSEYETSINLASTLTTNYKISAKSPIWKLAYPLYYWQYIINTAKKHPNIDPMLICGLIRQESRFETNALSISNARGLMQLIPPTAKTVSHEADVNLHSLDLLNNPQINVALGIHYLNRIIMDFGNPVFAIASYNAGPNAVKKWMTDFPSSSSDLDYFIEDIPYDETKNYVKKVFGSYWTYLELYKI